MQEKNFLSECWCTCELQTSHPHGVAGKTWPVSMRGNELHCSINFRVTRLLLNTRELSLYNLSFPKPHTCCLCASCFYVLHQNTILQWNSSHGVASKLESIPILPRYIGGLRKHAQSQTRENRPKIPSILGLQGLLNIQEAVAPKPQMRCVCSASCCAYLD